VLASWSASEVKSLILSTDATVLRAMAQAFFCELADVPPRLCENVVIGNGNVKRKPRRAGTADAVATCQQPPAAGALATTQCPESG
jgi:hypothetical protein